MTRILCVLLLIAGLFLLLGVRASDITRPFVKPFERQRERNNKIRRITGKPKGKLAATVDDAKAMLTAANMDEKINAYKWAAVILAVIGLMVGLALDNVLAGLVLVVGLGCSPLIVIRIRTGDYVRSLNEMLESAMGTVTNSYILGGDLIGAVENNLHLLPTPLDGMLRQFYTETQLIDADVVKALRRLRERIDNRYWRDWCDVLIQCQRDRQLRFALPGIVSRLGGNAPGADGSGYGHSKAAWGLYRHNYTGVGRDPPDGSHDARLVRYAHDHARGQNHTGRSASRRAGDSHMGGAAVSSGGRW